jgi:hypothetical protein
MSRGNQEKRRGGEGRKRERERERDREGERETLSIEDIF